eukprot:CAMPEP_0116149412 /NCGR_PEP_ID=MMETSP0329-20121206/18930_1 /TAXON_ID=697910 /ORGANISM="Pseudo-nitzschia arenysensis, Strain B593" /LENGTH=545 /DNA_ID=CAMNT_0003645717 /DNA_START=86 /DNA_END=1721 /DNA_ORIENTATION=-
MIGSSRYLHTAVGLLLFAATITESTATQGVEGCEEIFVGAGWSGVYSFYRRVIDDPARGPKACLFEESWRVGGRTYSVHTNQTSPENNNGFVVDVGAYRFSPDMHLPGDLILHDLEMNTECYAEDCPSAKEEMFGSFEYDAPLRRIVDPTTNLPAGYVTALWKMIEIAKSHGARVFLQTPLVKLITEDDDQRFSLEFQDTVKHVPIVVRSPSVVVLNLPRNKLFEIQGVEDSLEPDVVKTLKCIVHDSAPAFDSDSQRDRVAEGKFHTALEKAYLYYSDAWWRTVLHKPEGYFPSEFSGVPSKDDRGLLFNLRFHDGPVSCDSAGKCDGWLEIYYDGSNETIYSSTTPNDPLGRLWETDGPGAVAKLQHIHTGLMDLLNPLFSEMAVDDPQNSINPPSGLLVGVWNNPNSDNPLGHGYTAPTKVRYEPTVSGTPDKACGVPGLTDITYRNRVLQPWGTSFRGASLFLANNDWICSSAEVYQGDWAEESLLQAERAMLLLGTPKPWWLDEFYYKKKIESKVSSRNFVAGGRDRISAKKLGPDHGEW